MFLKPFFCSQTLYKLEERVIDPASFVGINIFAIK